jgi:rod shape-determining protein MreD
MRPLVIFATLLLLWLMLSELNHALAPLHIYVWIGALFVTFAAIALPLRPGLIATILGGLICDASTPVAFGLHTLLFAATHVVLFNIRDRVPREETAGRVLIALFTNLALFLVFSFLQLSGWSSPAEVWPRLLTDLLCSQVLLALITPWFFALQARSLAIFGSAREPYETPFK